MSRALTSLLLGLAILSGCATQQPVTETGESASEFVLYPTVQQWLDLLQEVQGMDTTEVTARLSDLDRAAGTGQLYYYGVLNQQLQVYGAWTVARDTFQKLQQNEALPQDQRQLASILRQYNQNRINAYAKQQELAKQTAQLKEELTQAEADKRQLEQKIQALTELEAAISTRKEE
ncbi:MAG: hypothetical protein R3E50_13685 [Halioglobus sp.]